MPSFQVSPVKLDASHLPFTPTKPTTVSASSQVSAAHRPSPSPFRAVTT